MAVYLLLSKIGAAKQQFEDGFGATTVGQTSALIEKITFNLQVQQRRQMAMSIFCRENSRSYRAVRSGLEKLPKKP